MGFVMGFGLLMIFFEGTEDSGDEIETFHGIIDFIGTFEGELFGADFRKVPQSRLFFVSHVVMFRDIHRNKISDYFD